MDRLSSSLLRKTKKVWSSRFICKMASSGLMGLTEKRLVRTMLNSFSSCTSKSSSGMGGGNPSLRRRLARRVLFFRI